MSKVKKQHFVPKFYLENFTNSKNNLYVFDKVNIESFCTTTINVAHDKFFYDYELFDKFIGMEQVLEKTLAKFEAESAKVLKKLVAGLIANDISDFTKENYKQLADYILTQQKRTPEHRVKGAHLAIEAERQLRNKGASDDFIKEFGFEADKFDPKFQQIYGLLNSDMLRQIDDVCDRYWIFWNNKTKHSFYTSDNPVVGYLHDYPEIKAYEIYFPLTPKYSVSIFIKDQLPHFASKHQKIEEVNNPENVKFWNSLILTHCNRQIYSAENDFRLAKKIIKETPSLSDPSRQRIVRM